MIATESPQGVPLPQAPSTPEETGLPFDYIVELLLKTLHVAGGLSGTECAQRLGVKFSVIEPAFEQLKLRRYCDISGGGMVGGSAFRFRLSEAGQAAAAALLSHNRYVGALPVSLEGYRQYLRRLVQSAALSISRDHVRRAFSHMELKESVLDELAPALRAARSVFLYGPPGNGKTLIARTICDLFTGDIAIPHAVSVEGATIRVYDPVTHEALPVDSPRGLDSSFEEDRRWVPCRRPRVVAAGELTLQSLELRYFSGTGVYRAPLQMLANGGILVIDDFGRARCSPRELIDRCMVPLESGVDFLTLQSGLRIEIPFTAMVVFTTNIRPSELADEAFFRRIQFKICAGDPSPKQFARIFERYCASRGLSFDRAHVEWLLDGWYRPRGMPLRACHPRDLINLALLLADPPEEPPRLTPALLEKACAAYFVTDQDQDASR